MYAIMQITKSNLYFVLLLVAALVSVFESLSLYVYRSLCACDGFNSHLGK